jgi:hypothetical protein
MQKSMDFLVKKSRRMLLVILGRFPLCSPGKSKSTRRSARLARQRELATVESHTLW